VSIAEAWDIPAPRQPLVPPSPPRASESMTAFGRLAAMRESAIGTWGQRAYEEDIIKGRFIWRSSFILNTPDAIRHVLVDNYENYTRTPPGLRVLRPVLGEGLLIAEGRAWKHQRRTLAPAFTPRAVEGLIPHMVAVTDETIAKLQAVSGEPVDPALTRKRGPAAKGRPWHRKWGAQANWCSGKPCRSNLLIGRWIAVVSTKILPRTRLRSPLR